MPNAETYVWRGQRDAAWSLQSSLDRLLTSATDTAGTAIGGIQESQHLARFQLASRGRRGASSRHDISEEEWWALGQHHGLATPLLDWTGSPYVALYFAFEESDAPDSGTRAVWAIAELELRVNAGLARSPMLKFVRPRQDENPRLVSQAGLFTRTPSGLSVDKWVRDNYGREKSVPILMRITIPDDEQPRCLDSLNLMNVNRLSLFPDLSGASHHCNWQIANLP